ncbi:MAG TPA: SIMPL domain-containing protein, partial [Allosphingosinicella sp.]|nr:SIMPL domain-containing protein [Allosphingosinicella sp.]
TQAPSASEAIRANGASMERLRDALRRAGIAPRDVQTSSVNLNAEMRHAPDGTPIFAGYRASHRLSIRFRDAANAGRILDTLVAAGANEIDGPRFEIAEAEAARDEARTRALAVARARADLYARTLGMRVARLLAVSETAPGGPIGSARGFGESRAAASNIVLGEEALGVTLSVSFELE